MVDGVSPVGDEPFVYSIPLEKFVYRRGDTWCLGEPVGETGIIHYLQSRGWESKDIAEKLRSRSYPAVFGSDLMPNGAPMFADEEQHLWINTWVPPTLTPAAGTYPRIHQVLAWLTGGETAGMEWLLHWMAYKVQNPSVVPKVAVLFTGEPGSGKGTVAYLMRHMLGPENCAVIEREEIESRFNSRWVGKLFVLADEVISSDNVKDVSNLLKILIDADVLKHEGKGKDQRSVKNRLAWIFASNDKIAPVVLERGDRRYSVFTNHDELPDEYRKVVAGCFTPDNRPTPTFLEEMRGLFHDLLQLEVDRELITKPYANEARARLIEANLPAHEMFCKHVDQEGIDELLDYVLKYGDFHLLTSRDTWDFGINGISTQVLYRCYVEYCKRTGTRSLKLNKFGGAIHNHRPRWEAARNVVPGTKDKRVNCYVVRRGDVKPTGGLKVVG